MSSFSDSARRTIEIESKAAGQLAEHLDADFDRACDLVLNCKGRTIVTGIGKSGHIGRKIAATLASTGSPAFFVHPGEASHGDFGMVTPADVIIAISYSGKSNELITLVPLIKRLGCPLIAMTGEPKSPLAEAAEAHLNIAVEQEACPLNLAPSSSTTATLVMGDALAIALLEARGFNEEDFAFSHPGGALGRKLLWRVKDLMHTGEAVPSVSGNSSLKEAVDEMSQKGFGMTCIGDQSGQLEGIFTDGDLRRCVHKGADLSQASIADVMTRNPRCAAPEMLAVEALNLMEKHKITALAVIDEGNTIRGLLHMHDLLRAGII